MQTLEKTVNQNQIDEWNEHPVTAWVADAIQTWADEFVKNSAEVFYPGEPNRTQEAKAGYVKGLDVLNLLYNSMNEPGDDENGSSLNWLHPAYMGGGEFQESFDDA